MVHKGKLKADGGMYKNGKLVVRPKCATAGYSAVKITEDILAWIHKIIDELDDS